MQNVEHWLATCGGAIDASESSFIKHKDDLTNLVVTPRTPLRRALGLLEAFRWIRIFQRVPERFGGQKGEISYFEYDPSVIRYQCNERIDACNDSHERGRIHHVDCTALDTALCGVSHRSAGNCHQFYCFVPWPGTVGNGG